jgi:DNA-binding NarL/FixJ family response regulator
MPRILLADDHPVVRRHVREILETESGFAVCAEASTGQEAVTLTASELPDIVILDLSMPEMNGLEAARQIHQQFPSIDMLILTMYDPLQLMDEVLASGVKSCVLKTDLHHLVATVRSICYQRQNSHNTTFVAPETERVPGGVVVDPPESPTVTLTDLELQIVRMFAQAKSSKEIALALSLTVRTVEIHRVAIMHKLKISSMFDLVHYAVRKKLVENKSTVKPFLSVR